MTDTDAGLRLAARAAAASIAASGLAVPGGVLAWFAYIDAPITDGAMALVALGVLCAVLAVAAALWARELLLGPASGESAAPLARATLLRRIALCLLLLSLLVLAAATLATLNLRGSGDAEAEDTRTTALAWIARPQASGRGPRSTPAARGYAPRIAASRASTCSGRWS
jgi:hypothetical protein